MFKADYQQKLDSSQEWLQQAWVFLERRRLLLKKQKKKQRQQNIGKESGYVRIVVTFTIGWVLPTFWLKIFFVSWFYTRIFLKSLMFLIVPILMHLCVGWMCWIILWRAGSGIPLSTVFWSSSSLCEESWRRCRYDFRRRRCANSHLFLWWGYCHYSFWILGGWKLVSRRWNVSGQQSYHVYIVATVALPLFTLFRLPTSRDMKCTQLLYFIINHGFSNWIYYVLVHLVMQASK